MNNKKLTKKELLAKQLKQKNFIDALEEMATRKGISRDEIKQSIVEAFEKTYKTSFDLEAELETNVNLQDGIIDMFLIKKVVKKVKDFYGEISTDSKEAKENKLKEGDSYKEKVDIDSLSRTAASKIKQLLLQKTREFEKSKIYDMFISKLDDLIDVTVHNVKETHTLLDYKGVTLFMPQSESNPNDNLESGQKLRVYVLDINKISKNSQVIVSRGHANIVKRLMEEQIVDIADGIVEIVAISRVAGIKTKVIVRSTTPEVDPVGSCLGIKGTTIKGITSQLNNERIDVISESSDPIKQVVSTLSPAKITSVIINTKEEELPEEKYEKLEDGTVVKTKTVKTITVIVPDDQNLLAIGKGGVNVKLAARLNRAKIDILTETEAQQKGIKYEENGNKNMVKNSYSGTPETVDLDIVDDDNLTVDFKDKKVLKEYDEFMEKESKKEVNEKSIQEEELVDEPQSDDNDEKYLEYEKEFEE